MSESGLNMSRRIRRTPYTDKVEQHGVCGFSVVNHMLLPKAFAASVEEDYWHLRQDVQIWDVACQRQVEISGPDATRLVQLMTPRDLRQAKRPAVSDDTNVDILGECLGNHQAFWPDVASRSAGHFVHNPVVEQRRK